MTRWTVGDFHFDANTRRLRGNSGDTLLEPKSAALLAYFCEHPNRSIGRDELLREVWHGQVVSDNSINRVIVLLRKALQDDDKARRYIATIPKVGYRMIADVAAAESLSEAAPPSVEVAPWSSPLRTVVMAGVGLTLVLLLFIATQNPPAPEQRSSVVPLSRLAVTQSNADLAQDGQTLLYTASEGEWNAIYMVTGPGAEPVPVSEPEGDADFAKWAHGDQFVVYQFRNAQRCEFHRIERELLGARGGQVIYECVPGSYTELSLSPDNSTLYFVERATPAAPYVVYALDIERNIKRRVSQPVARGYGNHYVEVHPGNGKLLLLGDHAPGKTSVYELDTQKDSFAMRRAFDYSLDSAIWSHREGSIVHPSRHPSYQLLETSLDTGVSRTLVSDSRRISGPRRIVSRDDEQRDYLFTSYLYNRDIEIEEFPAARFNSAVMDYLPAISHARHQLAFVSKRSGDSQIWIRDFRDGSLRAIEPPDSGRRFLDLQWSFDDQKLLANTNSGILVYSMKDDALTHTVTLPLPAFAVRWHDPQTLSLSHYEDQRWRAYRYHLGTQQTEALDERWAFSARNDQQEVLLDQTLTAFRDGRELEPLRACAYPLWRSQLRYQLDGSQIYCHAADNVNDLLLFDADMTMTRLEDVVSRYEFFSVRNGQIAKTRVVSSYSDIMRTRRSR